MAVNHQEHAVHTSSQAGTARAAALKTGCLAASAGCFVESASAQKQGFRRRLKSFEPCLPDRAPDPP
jgi:hypothetical protein